MDPRDDDVDVSGLKIYSFVSTLLESGAAPAEIERQLVEKGIDPHEAARLAGRLAAHRATEDIRARVAQLLDQGATPEAVESELVQEGYERDRVNTLVQVLLARRAQEAKESRRNETRFLRVLGAITIVVGGLLWIGNRTGMFPTLSYLGTIFVGVGILIALMGEGRRL